MYAIIQEGMGCERWDDPVKEEILVVQIPIE